VVAVSRAERTGANEFRGVVSSGAVEIPVSMCLAGRDLTEVRPAPHGPLVAFVVRWGSNTAIVAVPASGGPERLVTTAPPPAAGRGLGGGCFDWLPDGSGVVYVGADGALWLQRLDGSESRCLTSHDPGRSAEAPSVSADGAWVAYAIDQAEIWRVAVDGGRLAERLDDGAADFVFDPFAGSPDASVRWIAWDVPDMPWDGARVQVWTDGECRDELRPEGAAQQPRTTPGGVPTVIRDDLGWRNVWLDGEPLVDEPFEHAGPSWGMGQRSYAVSPDARHVAYTRNERGFGRLCVVDVTTRAVTEVARGVHGQLGWTGQRLTALRSGARTPTEVVAYDTTTWQRSVLAVGPVVGWDAIDLPEPDLVRIEHDDVAVHARRYVAGRGRTLCWIHGGPTDQWQVTFMPRVAYWWSRGFDVLVPDPRGTTGHGRAYQRALHGGWGRVDVDDTAAVVRHSHASGWSEPARTIVVGGSSGGLTALGVLGLHPGLAAGGVVAYPVTDIADLAERSHRFEAHYTISLVGPLDDVATYAERSPLSYADRIDVPLLVMHGDEDPVVPIDQSARLAERIRAAGGDVEYHVMVGEGHGFRLLEHQIAEYELMERFVARVLAV
jgi:dipeptidyl aminopeptidase/acylaminoacyl peptidase